MLELYGLTILEQLRLICPILIWIVIFAVWTWIVKTLTEISVNRKWRRDPKQMTETTRNHINERDEMIRRQQKELVWYKSHENNMWVAIREALNALQSIYKSGNERVYRKKEAS